MSERMLSRSRYTCHVTCEAPQFLESHSRHEQVLQSLFGRSESSDLIQNEHNDPSYGKSKRVGAFQKNSVKLFTFPKSIMSP